MIARQSLDATREIHGIADNATPQLVDTTERTDHDLAGVHRDARTNRVEATHATLFANLAFDAPHRQRGPERAVGGRREQRDHPVAHVGIDEPTVRHDRGLHPTQVVIEETDAVARVQPLLDVRIPADVRVEDRHVPSHGVARIDRDECVASELAQELIGHEARLPRTRGRSASADASASRSTSCAFSNAVAT